VVSMRKAMSTMAAIGRNEGLDLNWTSEEQHHSASPCKCLITVVGPCRLELADLYRVKVRL